MPPSPGDGWGERELETQERGSCSTRHTLTAHVQANTPSRVTSGTPIPPTPGPLPELCRPRPRRHPREPQPFRFGRLTELSKHPDKASHTLGVYLPARPPGTCTHHQGTLLTRYTDTPVIHYQVALVIHYQGTLPTNYQDTRYHKSPVTMAYKSLITRTNFLLTTRYPSYRQGSLEPISQLVSWLVITNTWSSIISAIIMTVTHYYHTYFLAEHTISDAQKLTFSYCLLLTLNYFQWTKVD